MMRASGYWLRAWCAAALMLPLLGAAQDTTRELLAHGRFVYDRNCASCHGETGRGDGDMGKTVLPRPRDFTSGIFKYRSTPSGALPTDDDLARTIRGGLAGTAMPTFDHLREKDIRALVALVKSFSRAWKDSSLRAKPLEIPKAPDWFSDEEQLSKRMRTGRPLFEQMCAPCHGADGSGQGTATELSDAWGQPVSPADLRREHLRSGREWRDLYRVLVTGLNGTPMPSFAESTTAEQRWEIIAFIEQLRREQRQQSAK